MDTRLNRRSLLVGAVAMAVSTLSAKASSVKNSGEAVSERSSSRRQTSLSKSDRKVQIISPSSTEFIHLLNMKFPGLAQSKNFQSLLPAVAIIKHRKGPNLLAQSVRWDFETTTGRFRTYLAKFQHPQPSDIGSNSSPKASAEVEILKEHECMLLTPFFAIRESNFRRANISKWMNHVPKMAVQEFISTILPRTTQVHVALDSGVFSDNTVAGKDSSRLAKTLQYRKRAEEQIARALIRRHNQNHSDYALKKFLYDQATRLPNTDSDLNKRVFSMSKIRHANYLLKHMNQGSRESTVEVAKVALNTPHHVIRRAVL